MAPHRGERERAQVRAYQQRLRVGVADAADAAVPMEAVAGRLSKRVRNGVFSIEWISRWKPLFLASWKIMPARFVPRWEW